jgi:hypothetical protein
MDACRPIAHSIARRNGFMRSLRPLACAAALVACLALAPAASAQTGDQIVTGTTVGTLALGIAAPTAVVAPLQPGTTATGTGVLVVTSTAPWTLSVQDNVVTNPGHLLRAALAPCSAAGDAFLGSPLGLTAGGLGAGTVSAGAVNLSGAPQSLANGTLSDTITVNYSQPVGAAERLETGCIYSATATYTVS